MMKFFKIIFLTFFILSLPTAFFPVAFAQTTPTDPTAEEVTLATSPSECASKADPRSNKVPIPHVTPRNCLFLEEPIGGKPGYDLYKVVCNLEDKVCTTTLWRGEALGPNSESATFHGPIQAILTWQADKPYQGPFGLLYNYLGLIYAYMSGLIVGVSVLFVVVGGIQMSTSMGGEGYAKGKARIVKAIVGIILWFTASLILYTINPTFFAF